MKDCLKIFKLALICFVLLYPYHSFSNDQLIRKWDEFSKNGKCIELISWLKKHAHAELSGKEINEKLNLKTPEFFGSLGLFITIKRGRKVRGCYGAFSHAYTGINEVLLDYLKGALRRDLRHKPIRLSEIENVEIIITVTSMPRTVNNLDYIDLGNYGVVLTCDNTAKRVFVPAELRVSSYINRYLKKHFCQVGVFRAVTIK